MLGLKSAILAMFQNGLEWLCPDSAALKISSQEFFKKMLWVPILSLERLESKTRKGSSGKITVCACTCKHSTVHRPLLLSFHSKRGLIKMYLCVVHALKGDHCVAASRYSACSLRLANRVNIPPSLMFFFSRRGSKPRWRGTVPHPWLRSYFTL